MSTPFYDLASLVLVPSGYKTSKVYAQKPLTTDGQLAFTRASTATRVGPDGLIEKVRTNLILQSEDITNAAWVTNASPTRTANTTIAPNGTLTADTIASTGGSSGVYALPTVASGVEHSFSVYIKNITTATDLQIGCDSGPINGFVSFNAVTGLITSAAAGITGSSVTDAGNGWYRVSGTYNSTNTINTFIIFGQSGMTFAVWGAQLETGVTTTYIPTTTAAVSVGMLANVPRLDYLGSTCPRLLLEPQRTNLALFSESFNNAYWLNSGLSLSANSVTSPDGYVNADIATETATTSQHGLSSGVISFTSGTTYTFSAFAKNAPSGRGFIQLYGFQLGAAAANVFANFDLNTGVVGSLSGGTSTITNYGNGWYRCTFTFACGNSLSERINLFNVTSASATAGLTYAGDITKAIYWYGAQVEASATYATSYIPTLGAAVTRSADAASKTGISALIGQTEGTMFIDAEIDFNKSNFTILGSTYVNGATMFTNSVYFYINNNKIDGQIWNTPAFTGWTGLSPALTNGRHKLAIAWKTNDFAYYIDGALVASSTAFSAVPTGMNRLDVGDYYASYGTTNSYNQALIFKTRLTNAQLAELTTI